MFVIDSLGIGGAERQLVDLVERIDRVRHDPVVVSLSKDLRAVENPSNVPTLVLERRTKRDLFLVLRLARVMKAHRIDIVQSELWLAGFYARLAAKLAGVRVVVSCVRGIDYTACSLTGRFRWVADHILARNTTLTVVGSESMRNHLAARSFDPARVRVIHNGISLDRFNRTVDIGAAKAGLDLDPASPVIGICARLVPVKDHQTFLLAAKSVLEHYPDAKFLIIGDGPLREALQALVEELAITRSVVFAGTVSDDLGNHLAALDVGVLCSKHESLGNAIIEYMAMGKPVVATAVGGCPELVANGETGILVPSEDAVQLAGGILHLLKERDMAAKMGELGYRRFQERFTVDKMVRGYEDLYAELIRAKNVL